MIGPSPARVRHASCLPFSIALLLAVSGSAHGQAQTHYSCTLPDYPIKNEKCRIIGQCDSLGFCLYPDSKYRLLGSPTGLAHRDLFGQDFGIFLAGSEVDSMTCETHPDSIPTHFGVYEVWLEQILTSSGTYIYSARTEQSWTDCAELHGSSNVCTDAVDADYIQQIPDRPGQSVTWMEPTFGGTPYILVAVKFPVSSTGSCYPWVKLNRTQGASGQGLSAGISTLSTDFNNDGDTDEGDEEYLRAALPDSNGTGDLTFDGKTKAQDLDLLLAEARRCNTDTLFRRGYCDGEGGALAYNPLHGQNLPNNPTAYTQYPPPRIRDLAATWLSCSTVRLSWTASSDDSANTSASHGENRAAYAYAVVRGSSSIASPAEFAAAVPITSPAPAPATPGTTQTMEVTLPSSAATSFAIRVMDDAGNWSAVSNSPSVAQAVAHTITDLATSSGRYMVKLNWTSPLDCAEQYNVRYVTGATLSESNWAAATPVYVANAPLGAGASECLLVPSLNGCTSYSFGVKSLGSDGTWSALSNVKTVTTKCSGSLTLDCGGSRAMVPEAEESDPRYELELGGMIPNPVRTSASLRYSIPSEMDGVAVDIAVFDVTGRRLTTLQRGRGGFGVHTVQWALQIDAGHRVRPGVYFVRMRAGDKSLSRECLVTR